MSQRQDDDKFQREMRDAMLRPGLYARLFSSHVCVDKGWSAKRFQLEAIDTVAELKESGEFVTIEEKIVRWKDVQYDAAFLETDSCTVSGYEREGWMKYGLANLLIYGMMQENRSMIVYVMDFQCLRAWFEREGTKWPEVTKWETENRTRGRVVKFRAIRPALEGSHFGFNEYVVPAING